MSQKNTIIDSHVHLDLIESHHPHRISWLKEKGCRVVSWSFFNGIDSVSRFEKCLKSKAQCIRNNADRGLGCLYLAGVHPRSIPPDLKPEQIGSLMKPHFEDPLCKGIGEIGLETGDEKEKEMLVAQLEQGRNLVGRGKIIGVHTPRSNKQAITRTTLKILERFSDMASSIVIDHCTVETIADVLDAGFLAGVTLNPAKTTWAELKQIVEVCSDRMDLIMCNTDSGTVFYEDVVQFRGSCDLPTDTRKNLFHDNAAKFFDIP